MSAMHLLVALWLAAPPAARAAEVEVLSRWYRPDEPQNVYVRVRSGEAAKWAVALTARRAGDKSAAGALSGPRLVKENFYAFEWTPPGEDAGPVVLAATVRAGGVAIEARCTVERAPPFPGSFRFETLDLPGLPGAAPASINDRGQIVGTAREGAVSFLREPDGALRILDLPGVRAINNRGQIVGSYNPAGGPGSTLYRREADGEPFAPDLRLDYSTAATLNDAGTVLLQGVSPTSILYRDGTIEQLSFQFRVGERTVGGSSARGMNNAGDLTGSWTYGRVTQPGYAAGGYLRDAAGVVRPYGGLAVNDSGWALGAYNLYDDRGAALSFAVPWPADSISPRAFNNRGQIVGEMVQAAGARTPFLATPCPAEVSPSAIEAGPKAGEYEVAVTTPADCRWFGGGGEFTSVPAGITTGSRRAIVAVRANPNAQPRAETLLVAGVRVAVRQEAAPCVFEVEERFRVLEPTAAGQFYRVQTSGPQDCPFTASSPVDWVFVTGDVQRKSAAVSVQPNLADVPRTAVITVGGIDIPVAQAAAPECIFNLTGPSDFPAAGGTGAVRIATGGPCAWKASSSAPWLAIVGPAEGVGSGQVVLSAAPNSGPARTATVTIGSRTVTVTQRVALLVGSMSPERGSGVEALLQFPFSSDQGFESIVRAQVNINTTQVHPRGCLLYYDRATATLQLMNDAGQAWLGPARLGSSAALENSQCRVLTGASSADGVGKILTLRVAVRFAPSFVGPKGVWAEVMSGLGSSGYSQIGQWTVPYTGPPPPTPTPIPYPTPDAFVAGPFRLMAASYSPADPVERAALLIQDGIREAGGCLVEYRRDGMLYLRNDAGTDWLGPARPGEPGELANSQCVVDLGLSGVEPYSTGFALTPALRFSPAFHGVKTMFVRASSARSAVGFRASGTVDTGLVPPIAIEGEVGRYVLHWEHRQASESNGLQAAIGPCRIHYRIEQDTLNLGWGGPIVPRGGAVAFELESCRLDVRRVEFARVGDGYRLTLPLRVLTGPSARAGLRIRQQQRVLPRLRTRAPL